MPLSLKDDEKKLEPVKSIENKFSILLIIAGIEGILTTIRIGLIPGDLDRSFLLGLSPQRLILILPIFVISGGFFIFGLIRKRYSGLFQALLPLLHKCNKFLIGFSLLVFVILFLPPIVFTTIYSSYYERLFFLFVWLWVVTLQLIISNQIFFRKISDIKDSWLLTISQNKSTLYWIASFLFPILFMTPRLWFFNGHFYGIGNDFVPFSYYYKIYLLDFLAQLRIPFWSPSEAAGFPFLASPQTQTLYPLNIPMAVYYWWKGSYGLIDHTWFTIMGISIFSTGMFAWLREFKWRESSALMAAIIVSISFKLTEIIRFTKAVDSIAWLPWILFFLTKSMKFSSFKKSFYFYCSFGFSLFAFITAGYLYYQYYSIFLLIPYILILSFNRTRKAIGFEEWHFSIGKIAKPLLSMLIPVIILIPYFLNMMVLLNQVYRRANRDFFYSTEHSFSWIDHLGSLVFPPIASPEGWYYFGILPLAFVVYYFLISIKDIPKITESESESDKFWFVSTGVKTCVGILIILVVSISFGKDSVLFNFFWNYFPFFYAFRYWGRFTIMLVPLIGFALAASIEIINTQLSVFIKKKSQESLFGISSKWGVIFLGIGLLSLYAQNLPDNMQWETSFYLLSSRTWLFSLSFILAAFFISAVLLLLKSERFTKKTLSILPLFFLSIIVLDLAPIGAFQWPLDIIPEENPPGRLNIVNTVIPQSFKFPRTIGKTNVSITPAFSVGPSPDWYFARYIEFFNSHGKEFLYRDAFLGRDKLARKIYFTDTLDYDNIRDFLVDANNFSGKFEVVKYDGEILEVIIETDKDGFFSFIDNWDPFWTASLNQEPVKIDQLFGTFKSVFIKAGISTIQFEYKPKLFPIDILWMQTSG